MQFSSEEQETLLRVGHKRNVDYSAKSPPKKVTLGVFVGVSIFLALVTGYCDVRSVFKPDVATQEIILTSLENVSLEGFKLVADNEYVTVHGHAGKGYPFVGDGLLVEPFRTTTLRTQGDTSDIALFEWHVEQVSNLQTKYGKMIHQIHTSSSAIELEFKAVGNYKVLLIGHTHSHSRKSPEKRRYNSTHGFICRYVRREIRHLTEVDRAAYFDALVVMAKLPSSQGIASFGPLFRSLSHFVKIHLDRAGDKACDHMHDGLGFLTQHIALTNDFETALQVINPMVTVPYWDFTYDRVWAAGTSNPQSAIWATELWAASWFGNATNELHMITKGRWAYQKVDMAGNGSMVKNPYGYMRAPWNVNKSPYLTRVHNFCGRDLMVDINWPSCRIHYDYTFDYHHWYEYAWKAPYAPHATIHSFIGGYTNCGNVTAKLLALGVDIPNLNNLVGRMVEDLMVSIKSMYRFGYATPPEMCSSDTPQDMCHMICDDSFLNLNFTEHLIDHSGWFGDWVLEFPEVFYPAVAEVLCTTAWVSGEQLEAASPADVSFWPIHPTLERLLHYKRLADDFDNTEYTNIYGYTEYCIYQQQSGCEGHHAEDITSFTTSYFDKSGDIVKQPTTNLELFEMSNPHDYHMTYVYDSFTWSHCSDAGVNFPEVEWPGERTHMRNKPGNDDD